MIAINGHKIMEDPINIINTLKSHLAMANIQLLDKVKPSGTNIQISCPVHSGGQETRPSCGISTVDTDKVKAGTVHCFTCGYSASFEEFVSTCFGKEDNGRFGKDWLIKNFLTISISSREGLTFDLPTSRGRKARKVEETIQYIPEEELDTYRYYHDYMFQRGLTEELIDLFDVGFDPRFEFINREGKVAGTARAITFPVRDINGRTLFIGRRGIDHKFFHYPSDVEKPLYGIYEAGDLTGVDEIIICESFINTITCFKYGDVSFALLGTGNPNQYEQLKRLPVRKYITAFDGDAAGQAATKRFKDAMAGSKIVTSLNIPLGKDVNDLTYNEYMNLEEIF